MHYFLLVVVIIALDQFTKYLIQSNMDLNQTVPVIDGIFHITYIHNYGAAFSILQGQQIFFILVTGVAVLLILLYLNLKRKSGHPCLLLSLACIAGGGIGNLINRITNGYVVDFLDFRVWPIFNVADISVTCGCGLLIIYMFFLEKRV